MASTPPEENEVARDNCVVRVVTATDAKRFTSPSSITGIAVSEADKTGHSTTETTIDLTAERAPAPPTLQNVVARVSLDTRIDLTSLSLHARNAEYNPKRFAAVVMRIREPKATALIFASGKMMVMGLKTESDARLAARKFGRIVQKIGFNARFVGFKIVNVVSVANVGFPIRLERLADRHYQYCTYEPELFSGLIYRLMKPKLVLLIFVSGKVVITGAKSRAQISEAIEIMTPVLKQFRVVQEVEKGAESP